MVLIIKTMRNFLFLFLTIIIASCNSQEQDFKQAYESIRGDDLIPYVAELGSDRFMGREPFTGGETITVEYLSEQLQKIGFEPAFNGSYLQEVPMVEVVSQVSDLVKIKSQSAQFNLSWPDQAAVSSPRIQEEIDIKGS
ncbi:MAG: hypothetical protein R2744_13830 [Bacteroidales bacterium]